MKKYNECFIQFKKDNQLNYVFLIIFHFLVAAANISIGFLTMITVDAMQYSDFHKLIIAGIFLGCMVLSFIIFGFGQKHFKNKYIKKGLSNYKMYVFEKILNKSIGEYKDVSIGTFFNALSTDLNSIEKNYLSGSIDIIYNVMSFIIAFFAMAYLNIFLLFCVIIVCVIPIIVSCFFGSRIQAKEKMSSDESVKFVDQMKELLCGFLVIKGFKAEKSVLNIFKDKNIKLEEAKGNHRSTNDKLALASEVANIAVVATVFTVGSFLAFKGKISIGKILAFVQLSNFILQPISVLVPLKYKRKSAINLINNIDEIIQTKKHKAKKVCMDDFRNSIELRNVVCSFDNKLALDNINITFDKGKSYAIVGSSGSGKSTLLKILMGFFDDYSGEIFIDNNELKSMDEDSLLNNISIIQQKVFIFNRSIYDNITMFKEIDSNAYEDAIKRSGLKDLISEKGDDYLCGDEGRNLSGGESQRIAIARCLLRNTPILLVDEATASLDSITANEVDKSLLSLKDITRIVVTHRLDEKILKQYDSIIVMNNGKIVENGSYDELMSIKKHFYSLYNVRV